MSSSTRLAPSDRTGLLRSQLVDFLFVAPVLFLSVAIIIVPALISLFRSTFDWQPGFESSFVGLENFATLFSDPVFHQVLRNQAVLLLVIPLWVIVPIVLALILYEKVPAAGLFRIIFFLPAVMSAAVLGVLFRSVLALNGPVNSLLDAIGLDWLMSAWLSDPVLVKPVIILLIVWAGLGTGVIIFSAALSGVDPQLFEAAEIDGASWWQRLWAVAIPSIRHVVFLWTYLGLVTVFLFSFGWVYVLTKGGPGYASATVDFDVFQRAFGRGRFGLAAAEAVVLLGLFVLMIGTVRAIRRLRS